MRLRRIGVALMVLLLVSAVTTGVVTGWFAGLTRDGLTASGLWRSNGPSTLAPGALGPGEGGPGEGGRGEGGPGAVGTDAPGAGDDPVAAPTTQASPTGPAPVLAPASAPPTADAADVRRRIDAVPATDLGSRYSGLVVDAVNGRALYRRRADTALIPASTAKVLTVAATLHLLGPDHRFTTQVRLQGHTLYLVGGGDPYLMRRPQAGRASVEGLARDTAEALRRLGVAGVRVRYDASLFSGPGWNPRWPAGYRSEVGPIAALSVDGGRERLGSPPRSSDPPRAAAEAFAAALRRQDVTVRATLAAARPPAGARQVAAASSLPLARIVETALMVSDNDATEVLFRQAALAADQPGSFAGGLVAVRRVLTEWDAWSSSVRLYDGSGLARQNRVPVTTLVAVVGLAISPDRPRLRAVATGLPVAGVEGSLRARYVDDRSRAGRGLVRGKTGTLTKVHGLTGYLRARDGNVLVFAFLVNDPDNAFAAVVWLDRVTAALSRCGC